MRADIGLLQPKTCPHCKEPNKPDAQFCFKCHFVMSFEVYQKGMEERETKDREIHGLKEQVNEMGNIMNKVVPAIQSVMKELEGYKQELGLYRVQYGGRRFTKKEQQRIQEFQKQLGSMPDDDNNL